MKRIALYISLAALGCSLLSAVPPPASAALPYCGTGGNYHDGFGKDPNGNWAAYGVSAQVRVQFGAVCSVGDTSQANFTNAWTMLSSHFGGGWAQTGYIRWYNHVTVHFSQWVASPGGASGTKFGATTLYRDELHQYWTLRAASPNCPKTSQCLVGHVDQTTWFYTDFDPVGPWSTPFRQQYYGETGYGESDVPGVSTAKTGFNYMQYVNSNNTWTTEGCGLITLNEIGRWANETISCSWRRIWTALP